MYFLNAGNYFGVDISEPLRALDIDIDNAAALPAGAAHYRAYVGPPDLFVEADAVHISVAFTYDKPDAERLAEDWRHVAPVTVGGVAYGDPGAEFVPGRYIKHGYTFTSRGCPKRCDFCDSPNLWSRLVRYTPMPRLIEEFQQIRELGFDAVQFYDDILPINPRRMKEICAQLKGFGLFWRCF